MLDGFSVAGYRSFGETGCRIADLSKVNVFIGKNNCGKSNVLRFVSLLPALASDANATQSKVTLDPLLDFSRGSASNRVVLGFQIKKGGFTSSIFESATKPFGPLWESKLPELRDGYWVRFEVAPSRQPVKESIADFEHLFRKQLTQHETNALAGKILHYTGGSHEQRTHDLAASLHSYGHLTLNVRQIDAFRRISESQTPTLSGAGLIRELRSLQSPLLTKDYDTCKNRFAQITKFLQDIVGEPKAFMEIPAEKNEIYVSLNGRILPLESLGTGIHELIIMGAAVTLVDNAIFCIEEPEIHLHPELQRKFLRYITENTKNQYIIASHSNTFLDIADVNVYRCWLERGYTRCELASSAKDKHEVLTDLGYRPSDLLQANYVIWVEGPSDRIYINHWSKAKAPDLVEGLHYAIMFYGGRLLCHLTYEDDDAIKDLVQLSCLNRNSCIVIDSDRDSADQPLNQTKLRVQQAFEKCHCLVWITNGRTIENYVGEVTLNEAVARIHKSAKRITWAPFADVTQIGTNKALDKVRVARAVAAQETDFSILDLGSMLDRLVDKIRSHNSLPNERYSGSS